MAATGTPLTQRSQFDRFLHAPIGRERNSRELSVLSLLARVGHDPWAEAARLAGLPRTAAADSLAATIACLPAGSLPPAYARAIALCLLPLLPGKDHPAQGAPPDTGHHDGCMRITLLNDAALSAALAVWLLIGAAAWAISHAGPSDAAAGATITSRTSPVGQPGHHQVDPERTGQVHPAAAQTA